MKNRPNKDNNFFNKNPLLTFVIFSILIIAVFKAFLEDGSFMNSINSKVSMKKNIQYSELKNLIKEGKISQVSIGQTQIRAIGMQDGYTIAYTTKNIRNDNTLIPLLDEKSIKYKGFNESNWLMDMFGWVFPIFVIMLIWMFFASKMQKNMGSGILGMGNSKKLINSEKPKIRFKDIAGINEAKEEVVEIVDFLKYPQRYISLGAKIPKGVLLVGSPGTGKTLLAKAVAGEANVPFYSVTGSSFIEMFVGVGAARVRDLFEQAKKDAPSIVFIDEIDAIGKSRANSTNMGGNDEREQTLNQLLSEMDGFATDIPIIVLAATNRPEILDPALLRPGRFDRQVLVDKPDFEGRVEILKIHIKDIKLGNDIELKEIATLTAGLVGADLANIINEAALLAGRKSSTYVSQSDLRESVERAIAGLEKKSKRISPKEKRIVAYHESGHALIAEITKGAKRVSKVSIIPRGLAALGYTLNKPEENKYLAQKHELIAEVDVLLAGRAAEEIFLEDISTGASNDLERATDILKSMVQIYGMTDVSGLMVLEKARNSFLNGGFSSNREYSENIAEKMDLHIQKILNQRYKEVKENLISYKGAIENMVKLLYTKENISGQEVRNIISNYEEENKIPTKLQKEEQKNTINFEKKNDKNS